MKILDGERKLYICYQEGLRWCQRAVRGVGKVLDGDKKGIIWCYGNIKIKQGPTRPRLMASPVVLRCISYTTTLVEHAIHCLRLCPAFGRVGTCLFVSVQFDA